ncbi:MAG: lysine transporter LysE [Burkholderiaceae bacterium]|nr:lysine transporter LysE [Burkholderiaceae bacterium]
MSSQWLLSFIIFALSMSISPGPNNLMVMATGANFGWKKAILHILAVSFGFLILLMMSIFGVAEIIHRIPMSYSVLKVIGSIYLIYLATKLALSNARINVSSEAKSYSFWDVMMFQFANPKGWMMAIGAASTFFPPNTPILSFAIISGLIFLIINILSNGIWALMGVSLISFLNSDKKLKTFNLLIAFTLILSIYFVIN